MSTQTTRLPHLFLGHKFLPYCFEIAYILLLPVIAWALYQFSIFNNPDDSIDAWVYFGYVHNFQDLIDRYGLPYYSVRFGLIFPLIALVKIFGSVAGYVAFVYLMYLLAGVPLYLLFRKRFSVHAAILAYAILVSSVWFARTVLWTYTDASGVPYLVAAVGLVFLEPKYRRFGNFAVGLLVALAAGSNLFALSVGGLTSVAYAVYYKNTLWTRIRQDIPWLLAGFAVTIAGGIVGYYTCCRQTNYFSSTLNTIQWSIEGSGQKYQVSSAELLKLKYLYLLPLLIVSMVSLLKKSDLRNRSMCCAALTYIGAVTTFFILFRFAAQAALLEYFFYFSYLLVPSIICMALIPVILARASRSESHNLNISLVSFLVPPLIIAHGTLTSMNTVSVYWVFLSLALTLVLILLAVRFTKVTPIAIVSFAFSIHMLFLSPVSKSATILEERLHVYARMYGVADEVGLSRYRLALKFIETMPLYKQEQRPIYFWYSNTDMLANSLQSTYLWGYSRLMDASEGTRGLPSLEGVNVDVLHQRSSLVLFDRENRIVNQGIEELRHLGIRFAVNKTREICEKDICYTISVLDVRGGSEKLEREWNEGKYRPLNVVLNWVQPEGDAKIAREGSATSITTPANAWSYGAAASIVFSEQPPAGRGLVRIVFIANEGNAGMGFLTRDEGNFIKRVEIHPTNEPQELYFEFANLRELNKFIVQTWSRDRSTKVQILEFSVRG